MSKMTISCRLGRASGAVTHHQVMHNGAELSANRYEQMLRSGIATPQWLRATRTSASGLPMLLSAVFRATSAPVDAGERHTGGDVATDRAVRGIGHVEAVAALASLHVVASDIESVRESDEDAVASRAGDYGRRTASAIRRRRSSDTGIDGEVLMTAARHAPESVGG